MGRGSVETKEDWLFGGLAPREASLSGDAVGISELGTCKGQWGQLHPAKPARVLSGQTQFRRPSADKFGISVAEVTPMRDIVAERKELGWKPVILV